MQCFTKLFFYISVFIPLSFSLRKWKQFFIEIHLVRIFLYTFHFILLYFISFHFISNEFNSMQFFRIHILNIFSNWFLEKYQKRTQQRHKLAQNNRAPHIVLFSHLFAATRSDVGVCKFLPKKMSEHFRNFSTFGKCLRTHKIHTKYTQNTHRNRKNKKKKKAKQEQRWKRKIRKIGTKIKRSPKNMQSKEEPRRSHN